MKLPIKVDKDPIKVTVEEYFRELEYETDDVQVW